MPGQPGDHAHECVDERVLSGIDPEPGCCHIERVEDVFDDLEPQTDEGADNEPVERGSNHFGREIHQQDDAEALRYLLGEGCSEGRTPVGSELLPEQFGVDRTQGRVGPDRDSHRRGEFAPYQRREDQPARHGRVAVDVTGEPPQHDPVHEQQCDRCADGGAVDLQRCRDLGECTQHAVADEYYEYPPAQVAWLCEVKVSGTARCLDRRELSANLLVRSSVHDSTARGVVGRGRVSFLRRAHWFPSEIVMLSIMRATSSVNCLS